MIGCPCASLRITSRRPSLTFSGSAITSGLPRAHMPLDTSGSRTNGATTCTSYVKANRMSLTCCELKLALLILMRTTSSGMDLVKSHMMQSFKIKGNTDPTPSSSTAPPLPPTMIARSKSSSTPTPPSPRPHYHSAPTCFRPVPLGTSHLQTPHQSTCRDMPSRSTPGSGVTPQSSAGNPSSEEEIQMTASTINRFTRNSSALLTFMANLEEIISNARHHCLCHIHCQQIRRSAQPQHYNSNTSAPLHQPPSYLLTTGTGPSSQLLQPPTASQPLSTMACLTPLLKGVISLRAGYPPAGPLHAPVSTSLPFTPSTTTTLAAPSHLHILATLLTFGPIYTPLTSLPGIGEFVMVIHPPLTYT